MVHSASILAPNSVIILHSEKTDRAPTSTLKAIIRKLPKPREKEGKEPKKGDNSPKILPIREKVKLKTA